MAKKPMNFPERVVFRAADGTKAAIDAVTKDHAAWHRAAVAEKLARERGRTWSEKPKDTLA